MEIICYACGRGEKPENTIEGIQHCQNVQLNWRVEIDLQLSSDGDIILFHDTTTARTTGERKSINDLNLSEIKRLNAGYNFKIDNVYPYRKRPVKIPTLKEVFTFFPNTRFLLDVHAEGDLIVDKLIALIEQVGQNNDLVIVSKFDHIIADFKSKRPQWIYGAPTKEVKRMVYSSFLFLDKFYPLRSNILMLPVKFRNLKLMTKRVLQHVRDRNLKIWVWLKEGEEVVTINSKVELLELKPKQVDGIFTEYPEKLSYELNQFDDNS